MTRYVLLTLLLAACDATKSMAPAPAAFAGTHAWPPPMTTCALYKGYDTCPPPRLVWDPGPNPVMVIAGYSNTAQATCHHVPDVPCNSWTFIPRAKAIKTETVKIVAGARGGQVNSEWDDPADSNYGYVAGKLAARGMTEANVTVVWYWPTNKGPTCALPNPCADAFNELIEIQLVAAAMRQHYPNLRVIYLTPREFGGWATGPKMPEPYAFETGLAVKWAVEQDPGLAWGPYLWDPTDPLSYYEADGLHRNQQGETISATRALNFFQGECWFTGTCP